MTRDQRINKINKKNNEKNKNNNNSNNNNSESTTAPDDGANGSAKGKGKGDGKKGKKNEEGNNNNNNNNNNNESVTDAPTTNTNGDSQSDNKNENVAQVELQQTEQQQQEQEQEQQQGGGRGGGRGGRGGRGGENGRGPRRERGEPVPEPDRGKYSTEMANFVKGIETATKKMKAISDEITAKKILQKAITEKRKATFEKLQAKSKERKDAFDKGKELTITIDANDSSRINNKTRLAMARRTPLKFKSIVDLEERIRQLDFMLNTSSLPMSTEKQLMAEIKLLNSQREETRRLSDEEKKWQSMKDQNQKLDTRALKEQRKLANQQGRTALEEEKVLRGEFGDCKANERKISVEITTLLNNKSEINQNKFDLIKTKSSSEKKYEYELRSFERFKEYQRYESEKKRRIKKQQEYEERKAREAEERKQPKKNADGEEDGGGIVQIEMDEDTQVHPYHHELRTISDLERHLTRLLPKSQLGDEKKESIVDVSARNSTFKDEQKVVELKKNKNDDFFASEYGASLRTPKVVKPPSEEKEKKKKQQLVHVPDILNSFALIELSAPLFHSDIPNSIKELKEKSDFFRSAPPREELNKIKAQAAEQRRQNKKNEEKQKEKQKEKQHEEQPQEQEQEQTNSKKKK